MKIIWNRNTSVNLYEDGNNLLNPVFAMFFLGVTLNFSFRGLKPSIIALKKNGAKANPVKLNHVDQNNVDVNEPFKYCLKIKACKIMLLSNPESNNEILIPIIIVISGQNKGWNSDVEMSNKKLKQRKLI